MSERRPWPNRMRLLIAAVCAVGILVLFVRPTPEIRFVLPSGFRGGFIVVEDSAGVDTGGWFRHLHVLAVPKSRVVKVTSFSPFHRWHELSVQLEDGGRLAQVNPFPSDDAIELRSGGFGGLDANGIHYRERMSYFYGTSAESADFDPFSIAGDPRETSPLGSAAVKSRSP